MKKILSLLFVGLFAVLVTGGFLIWKRYHQNPEQIFPYPYQFQSEAPVIKPDAPLLIIGDRMGAYFARFEAELATAISKDLAKPIKIQSLARDGYGLHRTLHQMKNVIPWPQIVIYQGASEEMQEHKFEYSEIRKINKNVKRYQDERIETAIILYPWLSRIIYEPIKRVILPAQPKLDKNIEQEDFLKRLETELLLYEQQLIQLVNLSKDRNSLLILTTTPINLDISPKRVCDFTSTLDIEKEIEEIRDLIKVNNLKTAYQRSSAALKRFSGNALLYYIHGQVAKRLGNVEEARSALKEASAYDCSPWRATEVYNSIIRKVARNHQVLLFDFAKLVEKDFVQNVTFFDDIHPQNLYYDKGMQQLGLVIKRILKL
jgi:hypothetical protein